MAITESDKGRSSASRRFLFGGNVAFAILLAAFLTVAVNWIGHRHHVRHDLASGRASARMSERTKRIIDEADANFRITTIYTSKKGDLDREKYFPKLRDLSEEIGQYDKRVKVEHLFDDDQCKAFRDRIRTKLGAGASECKQVLERASEEWRAFSVTAEAFCGQFDTSAGGSPWLGGFAALAGQVTVLREDVERIADTERQIRELTGGEGLPRYEEANEKIKSLNDDLIKHLDETHDGVKEVNDAVTALAAQDSDFVAKTESQLQAIDALLAKLATTAGDPEDASVPPDPKPVLRDCAKIVAELAMLLEAEFRRVSGFVQKHPAIMEHPNWEVRAEIAPGMSVPISVLQLLADATQQVSRTARGLRGLLAQELPNDQLQQAVRQMRRFSGEVQGNLSLWKNGLSIFTTGARELDEEARAVLTRGADPKFLSATGDAAGEKIQERLTALNKRIDKLPPLSELDAVAKGLEEENIVVVENDRDARVVKFDAVWPMAAMARSSTPSDDEEGERRVFDGDSAISGAMLELREEFLFDMEAGPLVNELAQDTITPKLWAELRGHGARVGFLREFGSSLGKDLDEGKVPAALRAELSKGEERISAHAAVTVEAKDGEGKGTRWLVADDERRWLVAKEQKAAKEGDQEKKTDVLNLYALSARVTEEAEGDRWLIRDGDRRYVVRKGADALEAYQLDRPFGTVILVAFETEMQVPPQMRQQMRPQRRTGPLPLAQMEELEKRLKQANFAVKRWNLGDGGPEALEPPAPEPGTTPIYVLLPPPEPPSPFMRQQQPMPNFGEEQLAAVRKALERDGRAIFLASFQWRQTPWSEPSYGYDELLRGDWGIKVNFGYRLLRGVPDKEDPEVFAVNRKQLGHLQLNSFTDHPVGRPLRSRRMLILESCPVTKTGHVPDDVTLTPVLEVPEHLREVWAESNEGIDRIRSALMSVDKGGRFTKETEPVFRADPAFESALDAGVVPHDLWRQFVDRDVALGGLLALGLGYGAELDRGFIPQVLRDHLRDESQILLSAGAKVTVQNKDAKGKGTRWLITDAGREYVVVTVRPKQGRTRLQLCRSGLLFDWEQGPDGELTAGTLTHDLWERMADQDVGLGFLFGTDVEGSDLAELDAERLPSRLREAFTENKAQLPEGASVSVKSRGRRWIVRDGEKRLLLLATGDKIEVFSSGHLFTLDVDLASDLDRADKAVSAAVRDAFEAEVKLPVTATREVTTKGREWRINAGATRYALVREPDGLAVYDSKLRVESQTAESWRLTGGRTEYVVLADRGRFGVYAPAVRVATEEAGRRWSVRDEPGGRTGGDKGYTVAKRGDALEVYEGKASWSGPFPVILAAENEKTNGRIVVMGNGMSLDQRYLTSPAPRPGGDEGLVLDPPPEENADLFINAAYWLAGHEELIAAGPAEVPLIPPIEARDKTLLYAVTLGWAVLVLVGGGVMMMVRRK